MIVRSLAALALSLGLVLGAVNASSHQTPATVVDIATSNEDFSTLVSAVVEADLAGVLAGDGPFTVFAPTNDAFAAALEALNLTAEELLASPDLGAILTYHVVPGTLMAADVLAAVEAGGGSVMVETVNGASITVEVIDGNVVIDGTATVIMTDLVAGNGVVHVIDAVILPPAAGGDAY
jgi:transforming growth factor-beta-induced protein